MTTPTRDITALMALDFIGVAYKQAAAPLFKSTDIRTMVKHSITLGYNEVTDITPDVRITFYNACPVPSSGRSTFPPPFSTSLMKLISSSSDSFIGG